MELLHSLPSQYNVHIVATEYHNGLNLHVFKSLGERTYNFENEQIHHPKFADYAGRSSSVKINPKSYHLAAFEVIKSTTLHLFSKL